MTSDIRSPVTLGLLTFFFAGMVAFVLIGTLRLTLSRDVQDRIKDAIHAPACVTDWRDFWASSDPVPNGATRTDTADRPFGTRT